MSATVPLPGETTTTTDEPEVPTLEGPRDLVEEYLRLTQERRELDARLAFVRTELEMIAAAALKDDKPRGLFVAPGGSIGVRLLPTCVFDRAAVARELQRMGKLAEIAALQGPALARYLAREPVVAARLGSQVRMRRSIMLVAQP